MSTYGSLCVGLGLLVYLLVLIWMEGFQYVLKGGVGLVEFGCFKWRFWLYWFVVSVVQGRRF